MKYVLLIIGLLVILMISIMDEKDENRTLPLKVHSYIDGPKIVDKKNGEDIWVILAKRADFTEDERVAKMDSVTITILKQGINVHSLRGSYDFLSKDLCLEDDITMDYKNSVLTAQRLSIDLNKGRLSSEGPVRLAGKKFRIEGEGLTATDDQKVVISRNVRAIFW
jgi:LPS export ABC transporter protein LptC